MVKLGSDFNVAISELFNEPIMVSSVIDDLSYSDSSFDNVPGVSTVMVFSSRLGLIDTAIAAMMVCVPSETETITLFMEGIVAVIAIVPFVVLVGVVRSV